MQRQSVRNLPPNKNPVGTRCIQITIPDDDDWERDLYSEIYRLALWMLWERDIGHSGKPVADRWLKAIRTWKHCSDQPLPANLHGLEEDFEMPLRVDCDCNVFVTCCDGTEKQIFTADQVRALAGGQPGGGSPVPPSGGCQDYQATIHGGSSWLLPAVVNSGDTLDISGATGATTSDSPIGKWWCPNGQQFFAGDCIGPGEMDGDALDPAILTGKLMWAINGVYYDATAGAVTVPGGIVNGLAALVTNYLTPGTYAGTDTCSVHYCNNAVSVWSHFFDFTRNPYSSIFTLPNLGNAPVVPEGIYVPGVGYKTNLCKFASGQWYRALKLNFTVAVELTQDLATFAFTLGGYGAFTDASYDIEVAGGAPLVSIIMPTAPTSPQSWAGSSTNHVYGQGIVSGAAIGSDPGGEVVWSGLTLTGTGTDPFPGV